MLVPPILRVFPWVEIQLFAEFVYLTLKNKCALISAIFIPKDLRDAHLPKSLLFLPLCWLIYTGILFPHPKKPSSRRPLTTKSQTILNPHTQEFVCI